MEDNLKGYDKLIKEFYLSKDFDGETWLSKEKDDKGFFLKINIKYKPLIVNFYKQNDYHKKSFSLNMEQRPSSANYGIIVNEYFYIPQDIIKAVNERLNKIKSFVEEKGE